jgi:hypothetical protein
MLRFLARLFAPNPRMQVGSLLDEIAATREQIADLNISLRAFDERLVRFSESRPPEEGTNCE